MNQPGSVIPYAFDLSKLVPRSVASLYSHLVTRPTGKALRLGIESQIGELGAFCVSVLDFSQVVVLDYSCADEVVAKLIQRYQRDDRPAEAYFIARGMQEEHRDPIEEVLTRHQLALVAETEGAYALIGYASELERSVWTTLQHLQSGEAGEIARVVGCSEASASEALSALLLRRVLLCPGNGRRFYSLSALLQLPN